VGVKLDIYDVIKRPIFSEKAYKLNNKLGHLVLEVDVHANKIQIKEAVWKLFNVAVARVNVARRPGKIRKVGRHLTKGIETKRAFVKLVEGHLLDMFKDLNQTVDKSARMSESDE
jgi:large subunit ribosomal protein L23